MKIFKMLPTFILGLLFLQANAQTEAPKGFSKGKIVLPDNTVVTGFIKDNIRKDASVVMLSDGKEKKYNGSDITSAEIEAASYICIKGDFFKVVCNGELTFLQKSSNASSKPTTIGNEVLFISGTEGRPGDYFIYENNNQQLKLVSKKNLNAVVANSFAGYGPAIEKAKAAQDDIAQLKDAVETYNNRINK
jgi:hypothetical protein